MSVCVFQVKREQCAQPGGLKFAHWHPPQPNRAVSQRLSDSTSSVALSSLRFLMIQCDPYVTSTTVNPCAGASPARSFDCFLIAFWTSSTETFPWAADTST